MNRREAIAALTALPMLKGIEVASIRPGDVIVAEVDTALSDASSERIKNALSQVWPDTKIVVCSEGMRLKVIRG